MTSPGSMHETGHSKPVHWETKKDGMGSGKGLQDRKTHVHPRLIHVNVWQKPP